MFISTAYAQDAAGAGGGLQAMLPLILIFVVFYFLLIRPQQKKMKEHKAMLGAVRRGDKVVTGGGIVGTVTKVDNDLEVTVEIAKDIKVKVHRSLLSSVISKTQPAADAAPANENRSSGGGLSGIGKMFGFGGGGQAPANQAPANEPADEPANEPADEPADEPANEPADDDDVEGDAKSDDKKD